MRNFLCGSVIFLTLLGACKKETPLEKTVRTTEILNAEYGADARNKLDLYLPDEWNKETKVIVFVHGDRFLTADKSKFTDLAKFFRDKGYVTASINYQIKNAEEQNIQQVQVADLGKAIKYISAKAEEMGFAPDDFGILGASSGAYISLLYTYKHNNDSRVKAVVSMAGPTNLSELVDKETALPSIEWYLGASLQADPMAYKAASPVSYVKTTSKPTLLFHGKLDKVVPEEQSVCLKNKLDDFQVNNKLVIYEDTGHEVLNLNNTASFLGDVDSWFKENLN